MCVALGCVELLIVAMEQLLVAMEQTNSAIG
jgi:hypothetical protein